MFKGLTQRAQRVLSQLAQEEAKRFRADQLTPEHVLLALIREGDGVGIRVLRNLKIDTTELRIELERNSSFKRGNFVLGDLPISKRVKMLLELAAEEARLIDSEYIGTEHLVIAAARESDSVFEAYLGKYGIYFEQIRGAVKFIAAAREEARSDRATARETTHDLPQSAVRTPLLDEFGRDLTAVARDGRIDPVIGREREIRRIIRILSRRTKNNPVLIGEPGVGKTAVVEGLAMRINACLVPERLASKRLVALDIASVVAGTKYRGEFEERLKRIMKEISAAGNVILFIDELHTVIGAGSAEGTIDASNMLKPALSRGEIQCIGATTLDEYRKYFEKDAALERRFQSVLVEEPSLDETVAILSGISSRYEQYHGVDYARSAIEAAAELSKRYVTDRFLPDKAIDLLDEAGSLKKIDSLIDPPELPSIEEEIRRLSDEKLVLVSSQDYERAAQVRDRVRVLRAKLEALKSEWGGAAPGSRPLVTDDDIKAVLSDMTGIPLSRLETSESERLLSLEGQIARRVVGQEEAIAALARSVRRSRAGISDPRRPLGSFIFLGPTGVGKTLVAKTLAETLFGSPDALIRIDMSDFMEKHNASRLVGAPPGYVGYDEGGMLTEKVRRRPYSVVLFDEMEKAHPDVLNLLLQLLEEGELRDSLGHVVSFRNSVIIITSNAGARDLARGTVLGFRVEDPRFDEKSIKEAAMSAVKRTFNPEFLNRLDEIIVFHPLSKSQARKVLDIMIDELASRLISKGVVFEVTERARDMLVEKGYDITYGARPMRALLRREIEDRLAEDFIGGLCKPGSTVKAELRDGTIRVTVHAGKKPDAAPAPVGV
ncbi:MAG: ATP-dependent Clp protease ATP-binding subunit [Spirochaetes bacterium]|nr:ATP-dependent Clp protease ATP-binding subunit [Spirochaetota bacterium]